MKFCILSVSLICLVLSTGLSCAKHDTTRSRCDPNVLILSSFEKNGHPSLAGWTPNDTTSYIQFSRDVPPNGGHWSLSIENAALPQDMSVYQSVPALPGTIRYQFSFWAKTKGVPGIAILGARRTGQSWAAEAIPLEADSAWRSYSASLTVHGDTNVSIVVGLSGSSTYHSGTTYFDLVKLEKVD